MLGAGRSKQLNRTEFLVRTAAPDYQELKRLPFAEVSRSDKSREAPIEVSADRHAFVYAYDNNVIYRSAESLGAVWSWKADADLPVWRVGISATGKLVAAAVADTVATGYSKTHYIAILSGRDGREVTRLPALGVDGVAVSPDNNIVAVSQRIALQGKKAGTQPTVALYDVASGEKVATLIHDQFYGGGSEFLYAGVKAMFTPDGRYVVTSGLNTKIWNLGSG